MNNILILYSLCWYNIRKGIDKAKKSFVETAKGPIKMTLLKNTVNALESSVSSPELLNAIFVNKSKNIMYKSKFYL